MMSISLFVDDILICGKSRVLINELRRELGNTFKMKDLSSVKRYVGISFLLARRKTVLLRTLRSVQSP